MWGETEGSGCVWPGEEKLILLRELHSVPLLVNQTLPRCKLDHWLTTAPTLQLLAWTLWFQSVPANKQTPKTVQELAQDRSWYPTWICPLCLRGDRREFRYRDMYHPMSTSLRQRSPVCVRGLSVWMYPQIYFPPSWASSSNVCYLALLMSPK